MNRDNKKLGRITAELAGTIAGLCEEADQAMAKMERFSITTEEYREEAEILCVSTYAGSFLGHILHECATSDIKVAESLIRFHVTRLESKGGIKEDDTLALAHAAIYDTLFGIVNRYFEA